MTFGIFFAKASSGDIMINRRISTPSPTGFKIVLSDLARDMMGSAAVYLAQRPRERRAAAHVPWTWRDAATVGLLGAAITLGAVLGILLFRIVCSLVFLVGEGSRLIPLGSYDHIASEVAPYGTAILTFAVAAAGCCGTLYAVYNHSIRKYRQPVQSIGLTVLPRRTIGNVVLLFLPILLTGSMITRIQSVAFGAPAIDPRLREIVSGIPARPLNFALLAVLLIILVPIASEIVFRGFLYSLLRQSLPPWAAAVSSAFAFAVLHGVPALFPYLFFLGIVFAMAMEKTRSVYSSIILHMLLNALATASIFVTMAGW
jgi:membrane protease YdiL (CAAX protease family)